MTMVAELGRSLHGRLLEIWNGTSGLPQGVEESYRNLWRVQAGHQPKVDQCPWRGDDTGERVHCTPCQDSGRNVRFKLYVCDNPKQSGRCTLEPADSDIPNCLNCPSAIRNMPRVVEQVFPESEIIDLANRIRYGFADLSSLNSDLVRESHIRLLHEAVASPPPVKRGEGRGIVIGVGGTLYFACAYVATSVLRSVGCTLPVEWWHLGPSEIDPTMRRLAADLGVTCVDALEVVKTLDRKPRILNGWELKPFSIAHSSFQEVLFLDADNICVLDPTFLFDSPEYLESGAVFWPDLPPYDRKEWVPDTAWRNVGLEPRKETDFESGQVLINKVRCSNEIGVTVHINDHSDWYYQFVYGDKTTFHLAWRACGSDYAMPSTPAGWVWPAILQHDFNGRLLFQHVCQGKKQLAEGKPLALDRKREAITAAVTLREKWHGEIWSVKDQTDIESTLMYELAGQWKYTRKGISGSPQRILFLTNSGKIEEGYAGCEQKWTVRLLGPEKVPTIIITGEAHKGTQIGMMFLTESQDGIWRGRWQAHERNPVELERI